MRKIVAIRWIFGFGGCGDGFSVAIAGVALRYTPAYIVASRWDGFYLNILSVGVSGVVVRG
ncbi:MAG: hypothetical protein LBT09_03540 [Planctomycetaceae bacterium]|jgi:hypothetical protein|nr:hypothetical protein [Planctomycetaceae bacterium]